MSVLTLAGKPIDWRNPPKPTTRVLWSNKTSSGRQVTGSLRHVAHLDHLNILAKKKYGAGIVIIQPAYNKGVRASAGTHDYDACVDVYIPGVSWAEQQRFFRANGLAAWWRRPPAFSINHIHGFTLPPQEGRVRSDDFMMFGFKVGRFIDGGWSIYGRQNASSQLQAYYDHRDALKSNLRDYSWFPADIKATIFDLDAYVKRQLVSVPTPVPALPKTAPLTYKVESGDTLSSIAAKYGVTWQQIAKWSKITNPNVITPGQVVFVSDPDKASAKAGGESKRLFSAFASSPVEPATLSDMASSTPFDLLDALLADWASPRVRRLVHALLTIIMFVATTYLAADGNWKTAIISMLMGIYTSANHANTPTPALAASDRIQSDDGVSYENAGGHLYPEGSEPDQNETTETVL